MVAGVRVKGGKVGLEGGEERGGKEKGMGSNRGCEQRWWRKISEEGGILNKRQQSNKKEDERVKEG